MGAIIIGIIFFLIILPVGLVLIYTGLFFLWQLIKIIFYTIFGMIVAFGVPCLIIWLFNFDVNIETVFSISLLVSFIAAIGKFVEDDLEQVKGFLNSLD